MKCDPSIVTDAEEFEEDDYYGSEEGDYVEDEVEEYVEEEEYDEGLVDIAHYRGIVSWVVLDEFTEKKDEIPEDDQKSIIRTMLALEIARDDFINGEMKMVEDNSQDITNQEGKGGEEDTKEKKDIIIIDSSSEGKSPDADVEIYDLDEYKKASEKPEKPPAEKVTQSSFPVSKNGACPYCLSTNVVYIILKETLKDDPELPELLAKLQREGKAECRIKGKHEWPSFQCRSCTYGFNLDWKSTSLENIFYPPNNSYQQKQLNTHTTAYSSSTNHNVHANTSSQSEGSMFAPQVNILPKTTQVNIQGFNQLAIKPFATPAIQPSIAPVQAVAPRLIMPTVAGEAPRLVQSIPSSQLVRQSASTMPQVNHPSTNMPYVPSVNAFPPVQQFSSSMPQLVPPSVPYMPPFQPLPGMFPMQPIQPPIGMPPQLASTLMNAINTIQSQQQMPFVQNPVAAPTLQWNGSNVWLAPPPPPQTQASTGTTSTNTQSMQNTIDSHRKSSSMLHELENDGEQVIEKIKNVEKQTGASSSNFTKEIETVDTTSPKNIETVDLTQSEDVETVDMTPSEDVETVDMTPSKNIEKIDINSSKDIEIVDMELSTDIETINMVTDSQIDEKIVPVGNEIENVDIVSDTEIKKDEEIPSKVKETIDMKACKEINKAETTPVNQIDAVTMEINKTSENVTPCPFKKEATADMTISSIESDKKNTESSLKLNTVCFNLPFADDSGEEDVSPFKKPVRQTSKVDAVPIVKDNMSVADLETVKTNVTSGDSKLESRKRSVGNSPLNSPVKHPRFDNHPINSPSKTATKSPERRSVSLPFVGRLELLVDEPDLMNDDSMGIDNNVINTKLLLGGEETSTGDDSPFTDSLFNIVGDVPSLDTEPISDTKRSRLNDKPKQEKQLDVSNFF